MTALVSRQPTDIDKPWMWRDRQGQFHRPQDMATRHLFYTLRMIWNHSMPLPARLLPYKSYEFTQFYTNSYMQTAVGRLTRELATRRDITPSWKRDLEHMINWLTTHQLPHERSLKLEQPS